MFIRDGRVTGSVLHSAVPDTPKAENPAPKAAPAKKAAAPAKKTAPPAVEKPTGAPPEKAEKEVSASGDDNETR